MTATIALVSQEPRLRGELARYLGDAGFEVDEFDQPPRPRGIWSLVWLTERDLDPRLAESVVVAWLGQAADRRVVIVTWRPTVLRGLVERHGARLSVLPPPVFGWQVVDALRVFDPGPEAA